MNTRGRPNQSSLFIARFMIRLSYVPTRLTFVQGVSCLCEYHTRPGEKSSLIMQCRYTRGSIFVHTIIQDASKPSFYQQPTTFEGRFYRSWLTLLWVFSFTARFCYIIIRTLIPVCVIIESFTLFGLSAILQDLNSNDYCFVTIRLKNPLTKTRSGARNVVQNENIVGFQVQT